MAVGIGVTGISVLVPMSHFNLEKPWLECYILLKIMENMQKVVENSCMRYGT